MLGVPEHVVQAILHFTQVFWLFFPPGPVSVKYPDEHEETHVLVKGGIPGAVNGDLIILPAVKDK